MPRLPGLAPLAENRGLAFRGERLRPAALLAPATARRLLAARNPHGKPNADVLRRALRLRPSGQPQETWLIDFPPDLSAAEAASYTQPARRLRRGVSPRTSAWWRNPAADPALRAALARRERYLATPIAGAQSFTWVESELLPEAALLAVARDDDFTHGVLGSRAFALWWRAVHLRRNPTLAVDAFPFPWPPPTPLSALTRAQEEHRLAIARAARTGEQDRLDEAVTAAYGWPAGLTDDALLARLSELHHARSA